MDKTDEILSILKRLEPVLADLTAGQQKLEARMDRLEQRMDRLEQRMDRLEQRQGELEADVAELKAGQAMIIARLDEQRQTINALIPTKVAAVPARPGE